MSLPIRRRTLSIALLAAALPAPAHAASGWLQSPLLSVGGDLRGVGFGRGGGSQVLYGDTPGFGEDGAPTFERSVRRIPPDGPWRAPAPSGLPPGLREASINASGNAVGWRRGFDAESSLVVSSFGTASRRDPGGWSAPRTLATRTRAAEVVLMDDGEALAAWTTTGRRGLRRPARALRRLAGPQTPGGPGLDALGPGRGRQRGGRRRGGLGARPGRPRADPGGGAPGVARPRPPAVRPDPHPAGADRPGGALQRGARSRG